MISLRPYQDSFVNDIRKAVVKHQAVIGCAATGAGKSKIFIAITTKAIAKGSTVLIMTESTKIFNQISEELGDRCIEIKAGNKLTTIHKGRCYVAMSQTLARRPELINYFIHLGKNLLSIDDETHIGVSGKIVAQFPDAYKIGFTATPQGEHLKTIFNHLVIGPQPAQLVDEGYLTPCVHKARIAIDSKDLVMKNGEFTEASQQKTFETKRVFDGLTEDLYKLKYRKAVIFCSSIEHCQTVARVLELCGFNCAQMHSRQTKEEQAAALHNFKRSDWVNIMVSVGMVTKGFDEPKIDLVVLMRATTSLPLFLQMIGRGSRVLPEEMNIPKGDRAIKPYFTVLDYGENWKRLGRWIDYRDWETIWREEKKKKGGGVAPVKLCPACESIINAVATECEFCGFKFTKKEPETPPPSELRDVSITWTGKKLSQFTAKELAEFAIMRNSKSLALRVAKRNEQLSQGFLKFYGKYMGYKSSWYYVVTRDMKPTDPPIQYRDAVID
jgi:superfamily II DNA or RNA helicase